MGSLTVGSLLSQFAGKRVLILERHFQAGGYTHAFARKNKKWHWDVGIHYVGDMQSGGFCRTLMDSITQKGVVWQKMPEPFEKFVYPGRTFSLFSGEDRFKADLCSQFPDEQKAIERYFQDIKKASALFGKSMMMKGRAPEREAMGVAVEGRKLYTLKEYLDYFFSHPDLKAILASQWGDYGLPPSRVAFATHAGLVVHYLNGGYYPDGGAGKIVDSVIPLLEKTGGTILTNVEVERILIEDGRACGVGVKFLRDGGRLQDFRAPTIVSGAGALLTYQKLIPEEFPVPFRESLDHFYQRERMATSLCVYLGLRESPASLGFAGENYWIFSSSDHEENFRRKNDWLSDFSDASNFYLSFPSLKDPQARNHTADVILFTDYDIFERWKELPWKKRGADYEAFKERIQNAVIDSVERRFPGFKALVEYAEVSTPLTNEHFTAHPHGAIYGLACVPERYDREKSPWFDVQTPVPGLYLTGADAGGSPGIAGAMVGGLATALRISGSRELLKEILKAA
ncbi:MAG: NAD(P)/FAD-dependent oxidoreductase [Spirochaetales bacterium]|nr:NAD(P)/FAD-dependent oxidoreductase [Spirochaetales bacterium]